MASPYIAANYSWRWLYFITSGFGLLAWLMMIALVPETRWTRTKEALSMSFLLPLSFLGVPPRPPASPRSKVACNGMALKNHRDPSSEARPGVWGGPPGKKTRRYV